MSYFFITKKSDMFLPHPWTHIIRPGSQDRGNTYPGVESGWESISIQLDISRQARYLVR